MDIILKCIPAQFEARLRSEKMKDVDFEMERQLAMLKTIVQESYAISKYPSIDRVPPLEKAMCQFLDLLTPLRIEIDHFLSLCFSKVGYPEQILSDMKPIASVLTEMNDWVIHRRQEVEIMCSILSGTTLPMSDLEEIKSNVSSGKQERTRVFILKMDYAQDQLIDHLSKFLLNRESFKTPVFWIATRGKHRIEHTAQKLKSVEKIHSRCTSLGSCHQIGLVPFSSSMVDGKVITVAYSVGDHPKDAATELPDRPIQPSINSQEDQLLRIPSSNSTLYPPVKTSLVPTVYNHQQLRTRNVKQLGPINSAHASIEEDCPAQKDVDRKEPVMAISRFDPDPPVQKIPAIHQHIQQASAIHQQDLDRQQIEVQNQEQNFPKGADSTTSAKIGRVAEMFAQETNQFAKLIKQGQPNVYLLNAKEIMVSEDFRWFDIDHQDASATSNVNREHKVIILMGATGCGKSTLINGMVNYILGVQWNDPFRFKCVREYETTAKNQAHSQTSTVTAYTLRHHDGMAVPYSITIIDTPGYGDTRGVQRDKEITRNIHQFLTQQDNRVDQIHAACFVAASGDNRLMTTQRYIDSVLSVFGKDVKENIRLLVTFADNAHPPVVEACLAANFPVTSASARITFSKFNSSVLYASNEQQGDDDLYFDELFWDMCQEHFHKFFTMLEGMNGRNLKSTREVIQRRQQLEQSLKDIETELEGALSTIEDMEKNRRELQECGRNIEANKNFVLEKTEVHMVQVKCDEVFLAYNCEKCKKTCEKPIEEQAPGYLTRWKTLTELQQSLDAPAVPALTAPKTDKCPVTPTQPVKVNARSCGRGRGFLLAMGSTGSPGESTHSGRGETPSRSESQNYSGSSKIPPAEGSGTDPRYQSRMSGNNSHVAASTTSSSIQTNRTEETKADGGVGRGRGRNNGSQESSSYSNSGRQVGHPPGEPENYYKNLSGKAHPKRGADDGEFSSEEETEQRAKQPKKSGGPVSYINHFLSRSPK
jgi:GTP-binding protein EngB required for normal cell division